ncbi:hypothetical protein [Oceanobacillus massiliensis]|uniref:hypothetical protein n=1 Tax=Oceanobacillus massiliensis TaxID=1465765 RepID=UPI0030188212
MEELGQLRVFVSECYSPFYQDINRNKIFNQNSEFFVFCALIGDKYDKSISVESRHEICRAISLTNTDKTIIKTIYFNKKQKLNSAKEMIRFVEEYANGGLDFLVREILAGLVIKSSDNSITVKTGYENELLLTLSKYVLKETQEVPF